MSELVESLFKADTENHQIKIDTTTENLWSKCGQVYINGDNFDIKIKCEFCETEIEINNIDLLVDHLQDNHKYIFYEDFILPESIDTDKSDEEIENVSSIFLNESSAVETETICCESSETNIIESQKTKNKSKDEDKDKVRQLSEEEHEAEQNIKEINEPKTPINSNTQLESDFEAVHNRNQSDGLFYCTKCSSSFKMFQSLQDHFWVKHTWKYKIANEHDLPSYPDEKINPTDNKYHCTACLARFGTYKGLLKHFKNHPGASLIENKPIKCPHCESSFWVEKYLHSHIVKHTGEKLFKCDICFKLFPRRVNLKMHIKTHSNEKLFNCDYCDKKFADKFKKKSHEIIHLNLRPHICDTCGASFKWQTQMTNHLKRHTGERRYKCKFCEKSFYDSKQLKDHLVIHTGEKNFQCDLCEKKFSRQSHLKNHEKLHFDETKYVCNICKEGFKQHSGLYRHMRSVHDSK